DDGSDDDSEDPDGPGRAQSVLSDGRDVGHHVRDARARGRRSRRPRDRARVLRRPAREMVDHELDDLRLDHAPPVPRAPRAEPLARRPRHFVGREAGGPGVSAAEVLAELNARIDIIEEAYEFFLAYASQGLASDQ